MAFRSIKMTSANRQQFAKFVKRVTKSIRGLKNVTYEGHDRGTRELFLSFPNEETADQVLNKVENVIKEFGYESHKRKA